MLVSSSIKSNTLTICGCYNCSQIFSSYLIRSISILCYVSRSLLTILIATVLLHFLCDALNTVPWDPVPITFCHSKIELISATNLKLRVWSSEIDFLIAIVPLRCKTGNVYLKSGFLEVRFNSSSSERSRSSELSDL